MSPFLFLVTFFPTLLACSPAPMDRGHVTEEEGSRTERNLGEDAIMATSLARAERPGCGPMDVARTADEFVRVQKGLSATTIFARYDAANVMGTCPDFAFVSYADTPDRNGGTQHIHFNMLLHCWQGRLYITSVTYEKE